ncbi:hypothetical protein BKA62DRAFT_820484 [Auriculariales sp. MPI-PUGE-AT-0066]|nr:hypothetical protein BKA62DRAFT_820484 [Auriculariales sp. MPI-PUGE-AT-0066]
MLAQTLLLIAATTLALASPEIATYNTTDCSNTPTFDEVVGGITCVNQSGVAMGVLTAASGCQIFLYSAPDCPAASFITSVNLSETCHADTFQSVKVQCIGGGRV